METISFKCDEDCEYRELANWEGHFIQECKKHRGNLRFYCAELKLDVHREGVEKKGEVNLP